MMRKSITSCWSARVVFLNVLSCIASAMLDVIGINGSWEKSLSQALM